MEFSIALYATYFIVAYVVYKMLCRRNSKEPPSFPALPIVGSLPFLAKPKNLHVFFAEKTKQYGTVFSFRAGSRYTVVVNGYNAIREALVTKSLAFAGRGQLFTDKHAWNPEERGISLRQYGEQQTKNRTYSLAILKQFGYGDRAVVQRIIHTEAEELVKYIHNKNGASWNPTHTLELIALNVIHKMMFARRLEYGDPSAAYITSTVRKLVDSFIPILEVFPLIAKIPTFSKWLDEQRHDGKNFTLFMKNQIHECIERTDSDDNFVKEYVEKTGMHYDEMELVFILRDVIGAGIETVGGQLGWSLILIGNHPEIQSRIQKDIDSVVPRDRLPSIDDKIKLSYLEATILEIMRVRTAVPLSLPHATLNETELNGYTIRSNIQIIINLWSAHMDPEVWPEPEKFRPERFLDDKENVINRGKMITFSFGKRSCLGEDLARQEMFLFLAAILQQFKILPPEGQEFIRDEIQVIRVSSPAPHELRLVSRC
jgi:cytochrome P450